MLGSVRARASELASKIPYQHIKDSPTIKYYTQWSLFDRCIDSTPPRPMDPPLKGDFNLVLSNGHLASVKGVDVGEGEPTTISPEESRIIARHIAGLRTVPLVKVNGGLFRGLLGHFNNGNLLSPNHLIINVDSYSVANIALHIVSSGGCGSNIVELIVGEGSRVQLLISSIHDSASFTLIRILQGAGSQVEAWSIVSRGLMNHHREDYMLRGAKAVLNSRALVAGAGSDRVDYLVNLIHEGESSMSSSVVKAIALGNSMVIHRGFGRISEGAKWSSTSIDGKVFIASDSAKAVSVPVIMVDTGDVNGARHSASDASLDEVQEVYLRMRGLSRDEARMLLAYDMVSSFMDSIDQAFNDDVQLIKDHVYGLLGLKA